MLIDMKFCATDQLVSHLLLDKLCWLESVARKIQERWSLVIRNEMKF